MKRCKSGKHKGPDKDANMEDHERKKHKRNNNGSIEQGEVVDAEAEAAPTKASELDLSLRTPATSSNSIKKEGCVAKGFLTILLDRFSASFCGFLHVVPLVPRAQFVIIPSKSV